MSLINWRKSNRVPAFSSMIDNFFRDEDGFFRNWPERNLTPAVNVKEEKGTYTLEVAAPGVKKEDFNIEVNNGVLTVSSETKSETEETKDNYTRKEFSYASFSRSFWLPENVTENDIKAEYKDGVLMIRIPKVEETEVKDKVKTIEVS